MGKIIILVLAFLIKLCSGDCPSNLDPAKGGIPPDQWGSSLWWNEIYIPDSPPPYEPRYFRVLKTFTEYKDCKPMLFLKSNEDMT